MNAPSANPPLIAAADKGDMALIERLLAAGAKVDAKDEAGRTALMAATQKNDLPLARRLIAAGSDVNARDVTMLSPYLCAGANGFNEILKLAIATRTASTASAARRCCRRARRASCAPSGSAWPPASP